MDWLGEIVAYSSCGTARRAAVFGVKDNEGQYGNTPASRGKSYAKAYEGLCFTTSHPHLGVRAVGGCGC
jgi:hypothetical protein